jgi:hypothetical protein
MRRGTIALIFACASAMPAQASDTFGIERAAIADGGATLAGGEFRLSGTVGQPVTSSADGGSYRLAAGFWSASSVEQTDRIFADGFDP